VAEVQALPPRDEAQLLPLLEALGEPAFLLVLDGVQDPHNLGACLRTADAAGVHAVIAPKDRACGLTGTVRKVASGAAETRPPGPGPRRRGPRSAPPHPRSLRHPDRSAHARHRPEPKRLGGGGRVPL